MIIAVLYIISISCGNIVFMNIRERGDITKKKSQQEQSEDQTAHKQANSLQLAFVFSFI